MPSAGSPTSRPASPTPRTSASASWWRPARPPRPSRPQIVARADEDAEGIKARAVADIESSKQQAIADLQAEVATLAIGAAEAVIAQNLDAGTQAELIDSYIDQVGAQA